MSLAKFRKMHGLGNDFIIFDQRTQKINLTPEIAQKLAHRQRGIGCDQIITLDTSYNDQADIKISIWNGKDGSNVEACGNASRCIAALLMAERNTNKIVIEAPTGLLICNKTNEDQIEIDMGTVHLNTHLLESEADKAPLLTPIHIGPFESGYVISLGNPHLVFIVPNIEQAPLEQYGPTLENHKLFINKINIELVEVINRSYIKIRVWERGAGLTEACGTGACASLAAAYLSGLVDRKAIVELPGGSLSIEWKENNHIFMTGPAHKVFTGQIDFDEFYNEHEKK